MSTDPATTTAAPRVVAVVTADDPDLLRPCLEAIRAQVYGPARVFVVGGSDDVRLLAGEFEAGWRPHLKALYDAIGPEYGYVWAVRQRARPAPGALAALIRDGARVDAAVAGSKVVDAEAPDHLVSVGYATDVFCAPYSGLEDGELDQAQFDVIRDVAAVSDTSMLIRRDLYRGLGGVDPNMPPTSAAIDFCQRARLRGGRVVVVPSSVVAYQGPDPAPRWRERAGETRAMIKAYSPLTLLWAIPVAFLVGLVESVIGLFLGRFPLPGLLASGFWNVAHLPSALKARRQARRGREAGDEELFRYQVNGSARIRLMWDDAADRFRERFPEGMLSGFADAVEAGQQRIRNPAFFVGLLVFLTVLIATREIWTERLPVVGFSLPPPDSPVDALRAYSGGWNPAGFGSPEVLRPTVAITALVQFLTLGKGGAAVALLTIGAFLGGAYGMSKLLARFGIGSAFGILSGLVLMAGPGMRAITGATHWSAIPAVALLPWAVLLAMRPASGDRWSGMRIVAATTLAVGGAAMFSPVLLPVPLVVVGLWALVGTGTRSVVRVLLATVLAVPLLMPWVLYADLAGLFTTGDAAYWMPGWWMVVLVALAIVGIFLVGDERLTPVGMWGGTTAVLGGLVARTGDLGAGADTRIAGLALVALGVAVLTGTALEVGSRRRLWGGLAAAGARAGAIAAVLIIGSTLLLVGPGRAGLPDDALSTTYRFASSREGTQSRILLFGPHGSLPGETRTLDGLPYRVILPPYPANWEAYLNEPRLGDQALHDVLTRIVEGRVRRAGNALSEFGIGWVVFTETSPLQQLFDAQLDLVPLRSLDFPVFRNELVSAPAESANGAVWSTAGTRYQRPPDASGPVHVASNADYRWGPGEWAQDSWAQTITNSGRVVRFQGHAPRRLMAVAAGAWALTLVGAWALGRREHS